MGGHARGSSAGPVRIELYAPVLQRWAERYGLGASDMMQLVVGHELGHAVTSYGHADCDGPPALMTRGPGCGVVIEVQPADVERITRWQ